MEKYVDSMNPELEHSQVNTRYGRIHIVQTGPKDGKPLLLLQVGDSFPPQNLTRLASLLIEFRIYAIDHVVYVGHGEDNRMSPEDESLELWIAEIMDSLNLEKSSLICPSYSAGMFNIDRLLINKPEIHAKRSK